MNRIAMFAALAPLSLLSTYAFGQAPPPVLILPGGGVDLGKSYSLNPAISPTEVFEYAGPAASPADTHISVFVSRSSMTENDLFAASLQASGRYGFYSASLSTSFENNTLRSSEVSEIDIAVTRTYNPETYMEGRDKWSPSLIKYIMQNGGKPDFKSWAATYGPLVVVGRIKAVSAVIRMKIDAGNTATKTLVSASLSGGAQFSPVSSFSVSMAMRKEMDKQLTTGQFDLTVDEKGISIDPMLVIKIKNSKSFKELGDNAVELAGAITRDTDNQVATVHPQPIGYILSSAASPGFAFATPEQQARAELLQEYSRKLSQLQSLEVSLVKIVSNPVKYAYLDLTPDKANQQLVIVRDYERVLNNYISGAFSGENKVRIGPHRGDTDIHPEWISGIYAMFPELKIQIWRSGDNDGKTDTASITLFIRNAQFQECQVYIDPETLGLNDDPPTRDIPVSMKGFADRIRGTKIATRIMDLSENDWKDVDAILPGPFRNQGYSYKGVAANTARALKLPSAFIVTNIPVYALHPGTRLKITFFDRTTGGSITIPASMLWVNGNSDDTDYSILFPEH